MKLSEKIYYCRKRTGQSQEQLAERLGVSRQAVSKWETGDAEPEIKKLKLLAEAFGVSVDWLLSEEDIPEQAESAEQTRAVPPQENDAPHAIDRLVQRYGWLIGVYIALCGAGTMLVGLLARAAAGALAGGGIASGADQAIREAIGSPGGWYMVGGLPDEALSVVSSPVVTFGNILLAVGLLVMAAGIVLAVVLRCRGGNK